jgi:hypothetical protein
LNAGRVRRILAIRDILRLCDIYVYLAFEMRAVPCQPSQPEKVTAPGRDSQFAESVTPLPGRLRLSAASNPHDRHEAWRAGCRLCPE